MSDSKELRKKALAAGVSYLARREHSQDELRQKLQLKGFPIDIVNDVIAELVQKRLQSDSRFTESLVRSRSQRGYGALRIRQELMLKGVSEGVERDLAGVDWNDLILRAYDKKFGREPYPETLQERARRERFLRQRGFSGDQIRYLFKRIKNDVFE